MRCHDLVTDLQSARNATCSDRQKIFAASSYTSSYNERVHNTQENYYLDSHNRIVNPTERSRHRPYTLVMGTVVMIAVFTIVFNLVVDVLYAVVDPRVRYD